MLGHAVLQLIQHIKMWAPFRGTAVADTPPCRDVLFINWAIVSVIGFGGMALVGLVWELHRLFGWNIFKKLGANVQIQRMFRAHLLTMTLLKLDVFFFLANAVQMIALGMSGASQVVLALLEVTIGIPYTFILLAFAFQALKNEHVWMMRVVILLLLTSIAHAIFQIILPQILQSSMASVNVNVGIRVTFFASIALSLALLTLGQSIRCLRHFGKGLKEHLKKYKQLNARRNSLATTAFVDIEYVNTPESSQRHTFTTVSASPNSQAEHLTPRVETRSRCNTNEERGLSRQESIRWVLE